MHKMEIRRQTESILAKLMGLDRPLPNKELQRGRRRVLSESYLQDIALICQQQKWSFDRFSMDVDDENLEKEDSSEGPGSSSSSEEFLESYRKEADTILEKFWLLGSFQKPDKDYPSCGGNYLQKLLKSPEEKECVSHRPLRSAPQNENIGNTHYSQLPRSCSSSGKLKSSYRVRNKGICSRRRERDCLRRGREDLAVGSMVTDGVAKQVANQLQHSVWHDYLDTFRSIDTGDETGSQNPHVLDSESVKLNNFPGNKNTMNLKVGHAQSISHSTSFPSLGSSNCRSMNFNVHKDWCLKLVNGDSSCCNNLQDVNCKSEEKLMPRNSTSITSLNSENDVSCEETHLPPSDLSEESPSVPVSPKEISPCSDVESLTNKAIEMVLDELPYMLQELGSLKNTEYKKFDPEIQQVVGNTLMSLHESDYGSAVYPTEAYKMHSGIVFEVKDISSVASLHAIPGLEIKLQHSIAELFRLEAERPNGIDDKDSKEGPHCNPREDIVSGTYKIQETQAISYLVDVLAELGLQCGNIEFFYKLRQQLENLVNPFAFDSLEKKYGKQPPWLKSECKLLFDRIKCALSDILCPYLGISTWCKHKTKRLTLQCNQDAIKEEMLAALVNQEKEARSQSYEKMAGIDRDWLELEEDMQIVVKEIQEILIDELVEEIISSE